MSSTAISGEQAEDQEERPRQGDGGQGPGQQGRVLRVLPEAGRAIVERVNFTKKHTKPNPRPGQGRHPRARGADPRRQPAGDLPELRQARPHRAQAQRRRHRRALLQALQRDARLTDRPRLRDIVMAKKTASDKAPAVKKAKPAAAPAGDGIGGGEQRPVAKGEPYFPRLPSATRTSGPQADDGVRHQEPDGGAASSRRSS